jgi:hypothetical protein
MLASSHGLAQLLVVIEQSTASDDLLATEDDVERFGVVLSGRMDAERTQVAREVCDDEDVGGWSVFGVFAREVAA